MIQPFPPRRALHMAAAVALGGCATAPATTPTTAESEATPVTASAPEAPTVETDGRLLAPMPTAVTSFGAAAHDGAVYVMGGYSGTPHAYSYEGQSRDVWRLKTDGADRWEKVAELAHGVQGLAAVTAGDRVCHFGGNRALNAAGEDTHMRSVPTAACLSTASLDWAALPDMPEGRSSHGAAVVGDTVYVAGGWKVDGEADGAVWATDVLALDLSAPSPAWARVDAPFERRAVGVGAAGGKLVVVGGIEGSEPSARVDVYDPATGAWSRGPDFPTDAFGAAVAEQDGAIFASARSGVVYRWAPGDAAWAPVNRLAFHRFFHELVPVGSDTLVAVGGISGMHTDGRTRHVEKVSTAGPEAGSLAVFTMDWPGAAKNRQGWFLEGEHLYAFGGNNSLGQHDFEPENFVDEGWRIHLPSMTVERVDGFPRRRQSMSTLTHDGVGIAVGGFGHDGTEAVTHPEVYAYDFMTGEWEGRRGLPRGRTQFGLAAHGGKLWVFGGLNYDPRRPGREAFDHVTDVLVAEAGEEALSFRTADAELPGKRRAFAGAVLDDRYYLVGGMKESFQLVDDCLAFDFGQETFAPIACPRDTRLSAELVPVDGKLYLVGGSVRGDDGMENDRSIEVYDPESDTWQLLVEALPFSTRHARAMAFDGQLLVVSTHHEADALRVALIDTGVAPAASTTP